MIEATSDLVTEERSTFSTTLPVRRRPPDSGGNAPAPPR